jgi:hypothetical protein
MMSTSSHYETKTAIAAENIGIARVGDKTYAIGRVGWPQDEGFFRSCRDWRVTSTINKKWDWFIQEFPLRSVTEFMDNQQSDSGILQTVPGMMAVRFATTREFR